MKQVKTRWEQKTACDFLRVGIFSSMMFSSSAFALHSLEDLSLEEKVGQVMMVTFFGTVPNENARKIIQEIKVGGIIYYEWANGLTSPSQIKTLSYSLQEMAQENPHPIPLLIAADQEGGVVSRLNAGFTAFPGNKALGMTGDVNLAEESSFIIGQEMLSVGVNMNFAPVVDINNNPRNPIIGVRSYGDTPETVIAFGEKALLGYKRSGVMATLKHFPGHGDVEVDSHEDLPVIHKSIDALERMELLPFARLAATADVIMTAHLLVPALDAEHCSTLSKKTLSYLRNKIGFQGVIVTDSLVMEGVLKKCASIEEVAIQALNAGCDILLFGGKKIVGSNQNEELSLAHLKHIHQSIVEAVKSGRVLEERVNQAVEKILKLKEQYRSSEDKPIDTEIDRSIAKEIATRALRVIKKSSGPIESLKEKKVAIIAPEVLQGNISNTSLLEISKERNIGFFKGLNPSVQEIEDSTQRAQIADIILVFSYNAWKNPSQVELIRSLYSLKKKVILVVARDPQDLDLFPETDLVFQTFSPTTPSIQVVCDKLIYLGF